ncbi:MAG: hypothetical protein ACP5H3_04175, partial [Candidatus Aenigmatarchaeota archaeon]
AEIKEYILNFIEKNECATTTQIAKNVSKNFRMELSTSKLKTKEIVEQMKRDGTLASMLVEKGKKEFVYLYLREKGETPFHGWLIKRVKEILEKKEIKAKITSQLGIESFDIETKDFFIEVETGLKRQNLNLLKRKIQRLTNKMLLIIVPNSLIKKDYEKLSSEKVKVLTFGELELEKI